MKQKRTKLLALLLSFAMVISMLPTIAFAETVPEIYLEVTGHPASISGDTVTVQYRVTNISDVPVSLMSYMARDKNGKALYPTYYEKYNISKNSDYILSGDTCDFEVTYKLTEADKADGQMTRTLVQKGIVAGGDGLDFKPQEATVSIPIANSNTKNASFKLEVIDKPTSISGDYATIRYRVTNTGDVNINCKSFSPQNQANELIPLSDLEIFYLTDNRNCVYPKNVYEFTVKYKVNSADKALGKMTRTFIQFAKVAGEDTDIPEQKATVSIPINSAAFVPYIPTLTSAVEGDGQVKLTWTPPSGDGGSPILYYEYTTDYGNTWMNAGKGPSYTIKGLTNDTLYPLNVRAVNAVGAGGSSNTLFATPHAVPGLYLVMFETNGGSTIPSVHVKGDTLLIMPADPKKGGYTFGGWYTDKKMTVKYDFSKKVADNFTLYAKWIENNNYPVYNNPFMDVTENDYFYDSVMWAYYNNVTAGISYNMFAPYSTCTRGQVATFLWRAAGGPEPNSLYNPFNDVKPSDYFYKAVLWAVEQGITSGTSRTTFSPNQDCSSAHIITFLYRANGGINGWYEEARYWAEQCGLTVDTGLYVSPNEQCPRGAVVTFLCRNILMQ